MLNILDSPIRSNITVKMIIDALQHDRRPGSKQEDGLAIFYVSQQQTQDLASRSGVRIVVIAEGMVSVTYNQAEMVAE